MSFRVAGARDCAPCQESKVSKTWGFCSISKNDGRHGTFEEDLQRCIFRGKRSTRDMFIRAVRKSGRWFPERGCILEHQIFRHHFFVEAQYFRQVEWKIAKRIGTRPSALHSTFHVWKKSQRIASFLMLSTSKNEVSQTCFVFDVVKWGSLAELLRFWRCQVQKMRKSRRLAAFLMLSSSKTEEVSQNSFVFKLADRQIDREATTTASATTSTTTLHYYYNYKYKYTTLHYTTLITLRYTNYI